jgi:hypothetical protein
MKREIYYLLITGLIFLGVFTQESSAEADMIKRVIKIEAEGDLLHYQEESFWDEESFYEVISSKEKFEAKKIDSFKRDAESLGRNIVNPSIKFDESKRTTLLLCDVKGTRQGNWYDFDWFLRPLGLDFLDSHFERKDMELYWEGKIRGINAIISIKFPFPISNCHEHVWRR